MSGNDAMLTCSPSKTTSSYDSSEMTHRSCRLATAAIPSRSSRVSTPPVGLFGEFMYNTRVRGVIFASSSSMSKRHPADSRSAYGTGTPFATRTLPAVAGHSGSGTSTSSPGSINA